MSFEVLEFQCDNCDFHSSDLDTWGIWEYLLPNGVRIQAEIRLGWCHDCKNIAPVEYLDVSAAQAEVKKRQEYLATLKADSSLQEDVEDWQFYANRLADAEDYLSVITNRKSPPKCLSCGSDHAVAPVVSSTSGVESDGVPVPTGFTHPGCGGQITMSYDGFRIALQPQAHRFTPEGLRIEDQRVSGYSVPDYEYFDDREVNNAKIRGYTSAKRHTYPQSNVSFVC